MYGETVKVTSESIHASETRKRRVSLKYTNHSFKILGSAPWYFELPGPVYFLRTSYFIIFPLNKKLKKKARLQLSCHTFLSLNNRSVSY